MEVVGQNPQFKVRIVTKSHGEISFEDLRGHVVQFACTRHLGQEAGSFTLTLLQKRPPAKFNAESWTHIIDTMDYVELWAWIPPRTPDRPLMRGWVDGVGGTFSIGDGQPAQAVQVTGRDFGKLALMTKLYYTDEVDGQVDAEQIAIMQHWRDGFDKVMKVKREEIGELSPPAGDNMEDVLHPLDIMKVIFNEFLVPQIDALQGTFKEFSASLPNPVMAFKFDGIDAATDENLTLYSSVFAPVHVDTNALVDVWSLLRAYQNSPWRELFFDEDPEAPVLRYRETPWLDKSGSAVQPVNGAPFASSVQTVPVSLRDRTEWALYRSDEKISNFIFTFPADFAASAQAALTQGPQEGVMASPVLQSNPYLIGFQATLNDPGGIGAFKSSAGAAEESSFQRHGIRPKNFPSPYFSTDVLRSKAGIEATIDDVISQGRDLNLRLVRAIDHMGLLEFGSLAVKGDERLRIGNYLQFIETGARYYVVSLTQTFRQATQGNDGHFMSSMAVERGRGHLVATKQAAG
jgi:hypothetical protein